ncbi:pyridoxamine 5'-phosphate oxidase family protein [Paracoccus sp. (in: a-proteobacteria)]|uniref:pyridoxamine 5'-phosphate oxidase family protein n=1 Tax=Paracoccus sp. TaxID=267 RepID=UPI0026DF74E5|nr:pyridoxamine 5'-phosphate oxidase family protein [Paracoccus sp. (in: a-proteobacteria)]MDO5647958.1 pyridoxamine 5'-phosphate oxidase family protein [Paracoccus sp. (in: a-proteobacteria)]
MTDNNTLFWDRLDGINSGMLGIIDGARLVPMSHYADPDENALWFITATGTDLANQANGDEAIHVVSDGGKGLFARIHGTLSRSDDQEKLDELWNAIASSWFEDGRQDDDVQLLKLSLTEAEVWATNGSLSFLYQIAKSKITGSKPDMGDHFDLTF